VTAGEPTLDADRLRAMGINHELFSNDDELVAMVTMLLDLGVELDDMVGVDLTFLAAPRMIRPNATIEPTEVFRGSAEEAEFRGRAAVALGFNIDEDTRLLTADEVDTITFFNEMRVLLGDDDMLSLMRVMGSSMGRLARSVISSLRVHYETPILEETQSLAEVGAAYRAITEQMLPPFLDAAATVLRRHLSVVASSPTPWNVDGSRTATMENLTVGFVDMVGFTSFTEQANLEQFVEALTHFESEAQIAIITNGGTLVKLIGDEVMFVAPTASAGIAIARRLAGLSLTDGGPGALRIGLAAGQVVAIGGDYYGTVVNVAARAVGHAEPDTILATASVVNGAHAATRFDPIGPRQLRGISAPVELFQLRM
jgi:class 3 adenylate cyclase